MDGCFQTLEKAAEFHSRAQSRKSSSKQQSCFFDVPTQHAGNLATQRLLRSGAIRPKLAVSQPGDTYEREADRVADQIMRMPEPSLQRTCAACEAGATPCPKCDDADKSLQRKTEASAKPKPTGMSAPDSFVQSLGSGQPLEPGIREYFEPRFGADLTHVRVHTDVRATESALSINAKAYTIGQHVVFGTGQHQIHTSRGRRLLAHELAHVFQQGSATPAKRKNENVENDGSARIVSASTKDLPITALGAGVDRLQLQQMEEETSASAGSQSFTPAPVPPVMPPSLPPPQKGPPVYICWAPTEAAPIANHSWFRISGPEPQEDHETYSLFPKIVKKDSTGSGCAQGIPVIGSVDRTDILRPSRCVKTPLNLACIQSRFSAYPIGYYCPLGTNSNTFTGSTARSCGCNYEPPDIVPGFDMSPPEAGTFGPDWTTMATRGLLTCGPKECK
jgi:Domain of unknown function (DUF4157)